jgi:hypothetical protein
VLIQPILNSSTRSFARIKLFSRSHRGERAGSA